MLCADSSKLLPSATRAILRQPCRPFTALIVGSPEPPGPLQVRVRPTRISARPTKPRPETVSPRAHQHPAASARLTGSSLAPVAPRPLAGCGDERWFWREAGYRRRLQLVSTPANAVGWGRSARAERRRGEARLCGQ